MNKLLNPRIGNYQGPDDCAAVIYGKEGSGSDRIGVASLVHKAKEHGAEAGLTVPEHLCRPNGAEETHGLFKPVAASAPAAEADTKAQLPLLHRYRCGENPYGGRRWLLHNVLPEQGVAFEAGAYGTGKTFVSVDAALSISARMPFAGMEVDRPGGVLWLAAEGETEVPVRADAWMQNRKPAANPAFIWVDDVPAILSPGGEEATLAIAKAAQQQFEQDGLPLSMIVVDTVLSSAGWTDGNASAEGQEFVRRWRRIARQLGLLVLLVDHHGKSAEAGIMGSVAKAAGADAILTVLADKAADGTASNHRLVIEKVRGGAAGRVIPFTLDPVQVGEDDRGRPVTTCVARWPDPKAELFRPTASASEPAAAAPGSKFDPRGPSEATLQCYVGAIKETLHGWGGGEFTTRRLAEMLLQRDDLRRFGEIMDEAGNIELRTVERRLKAVRVDRRWKDELRPYWSSNKGQWKGRADLVSRPAMEPEVAAAVRRRGKLGANTGEAAA